MRLLLVARSALLAVFFSTVLFVSPSQATMVTISFEGTIGGLIDEGMDPFLGKLFGPFEGRLAYSTASSAFDFSIITETGMILNQGQSATIQPGHIVIREPFSSHFSTCLFDDPCFIGGSGQGRYQGSETCPPGLRSFNYQGSWTEPQAMIIPGSVISFRFSGTEFDQNDPLAMLSADSGSFELVAPGHVGSYWLGAFSAPTITTLNAEPIPEPSTLLLLLGSGFMFVRRRKERN